jgi:calcineurin-like phosphoesterase family protein
MQTWFTADTHFGHAKIIGYTKRPFRDVCEMDEIMIQRWNATVGPGDLVFHLGDFGMVRRHDPRSYLAKLNGTIILIPGNHDSKRVRKHFPFSCERMEMRLGEYFCLLNHRPAYPPGTPDPYSGHDIGVNASRYTFVISGHIHEKRLWTGKSLNVGVDMHGFRPLSIDFVRNLLDARHKVLCKHEGEGK